MLGQAQIKWAPALTPLNKLPRLLWSMEVAGVVTAEAAQSSKRVCIFFKPMSEYFPEGQFSY
jgi:hypothetical protein